MFLCNACDLHFAHILLDTMFLFLGDYIAKLLDEVTRFGNEILEDQNSCMHSVSNLLDMAVTYRDDAAIESDFVL